MRSIPQCLSLAVLAVLVNACERPTDPTSPPSRMLAAGTPSRSISDAAHSGRLGVYFLPSLVDNPGSFSGTFDATLTPTALICGLNAVAAGACDTSPLVYFPFGGGGPTGITVDALTESYNAIWNKPTLDIGKYRLQIAAPVPVDGQTISVPLGSVDLQVVSKKKDPVDPGFVPVVKGSPIPVKFRIETGTVGLIRFRAPIHLAVGETFKFNASVIDLHGQTMSLAITWTTADPTIATVDADGTVHALSVGSVKLAATSGGVTLAYILRVIVPN